MRFWSPVGNIGIKVAAENYVMKTGSELSRIRDLSFALILLIGFSFAIGCQKKDSMAALSKKLCEAVSKGYLAEVQKLLREHPKLVNFPGSDEMISSPLHFAVNNNRFEIANVLLQNGADINARNKHGMTPLHLAAMNGNTELAQMLLSHNARKDIRDYWGQSALMYATKRQHPDIEKLLK
jgi:ankyrin repeat protein